MLIMMPFMYFTSELENSSIAEKELTRVSISQEVIPLG